MSPEEYMQGVAAGYFPRHDKDGCETRETIRAGCPADADLRKRAPIARGVLDYFPLAIFAVAELSLVGNEQHNPGEPMHWAREKSLDHADCVARHLIERGMIDADGVRHSTKLAWRALALLELELEAAAFEA